MHAIRPGGLYLLLPHGECYFNRTHARNCLSDHPKKGVAQINFDSGPHFNNKTETLESLNVLKAFFEAGALKAHVETSFPLERIRSAYAKSAEGHVVGKIAITT